MVDLLEVLHAMATDGLTWSTLITIFLAVNKVIEGRHKRKVNMQMQSDIAAIRRSLGIGQTAINTRTNYNILSRSLLAVMRPAERRRKTDMQINKTILLPLLAAIATFVKQAFGYEIGDENVNLATDLILFGISVTGIFVHPKKPKEVTVNAQHTDFDDAV